MSNLIWIALELPGGGTVWHGKSVSEAADAPAVEMADKPSIEDLKISDLTVAQFRQVMQECLDADRHAPFDKGLAW